jgi:molybdopterin-guanine dinucleotide biosynthesis protein A
MGRDKALIELDGVPLARRVARAAQEAGAREVITVGGPDVGLRRADDEAPGEGPLGGVLTALAALPDDVVLVVSCDLVAPSPEVMAATVAGLTGDVAVPRLPEGPPQWLHAAWRRAAATTLRDQFATGERSIGRAVRAGGLDVAWVTGLDPAALADADSPEDLPPARLGPGPH